MDLGAMFEMDSSESESKFSSYNNDEDFIIPQRKKRGQEKLFHACATRQTYVSIIKIRQQRKERHTFRELLTPVGNGVSQSSSLNIHSKL